MTNKEQKDLPPPIWSFPTLNNLPIWRPSNPLSYIYLYHYFALLIALEMTSYFSPKKKNKN